MAATTSRKSFYLLCFDRLNSFGAIIGGAAVQVKLSEIAWVDNDLLCY